ncbi:MAG: hypothetical protein AAFV38_01720, partial [Pseudomonadota bacterium]
MPSDSVEFDEAGVRMALRKAWSIETAQQWSAENPANGQCNVTAALIHDLFGGEVLRTRMKGIWHYYNRINGVRMDLTDSQFTDPGARFDPPDGYDDDLSSPEAALQTIPQSEYDTLKSRLLQELGKSA